MRGFGEGERRLKVSIITAFPEMFDGFLAASIVGRAVKNGLIEVSCVNLRSFGRGNYRQIDDYSFGSGGMVLMAEPLRLALESIANEDTFVVSPSPQGRLLSHGMVKSFVEKKHVAIVCGHYEGMDERFVEKYVQLEVSIGDAVLSGGEIPAMAIVDSMSRLVPGVVGKMESVEEDSFFNGILDYPHYTRPADWHGMKVPEVLISGHAAKIAEWRRNEALRRTVERRPDLLRDSL